MGMIRNVINDCRWLLRGAPADSVSRSAYVAASQSRHREKAWIDATANSADGHLLPELQDIRKRARHECRNNSYAAGMMRTWANYVIGTGPRLQVRTEDEGRNEAIEKSWRDWARHADAAGILSLGELLHQGERQLWPCGEYFLIRRTDAVRRGGISLRYLAIEPERVNTPGGEDDSNPILRRGIEHDRWTGRPVRYHVQKDHPDDSWAVSEWYPVPAEDIIHEFIADRPGQTRGQPLIAAALPLLADLRRYTNATIRAAEVAALFAAAVHTTGQDVNTADLDPEVVDIEPGTITTLPSGWNITQVKPEHPTTTYEMFKRQVLAEMGASVQMPYNVVALDSSGHNFSSSKQDWQAFHQAIECRRQRLQEMVLRRVFEAFLREYQLVAGVDQAWADEALQACEWIWPGLTYIDPTKEVAADVQAIANCTDTLSAVWERRGMDWREALKQIAKERRLMADLNIAVQNATAFKSAPTVPDDDDQDQQTDEGVTDEA